MPEPLVLLLVALAGLLAGVASGLFGVGGGILMVPAALYLVPGTDFHVAKAASLVVIVASAGVGIWTHHRHGSVDFRRGLLLAVAGFAGTAVSVVVAERVTGDALTVGFGAVMVVAGVRLARGGTPEPRRLKPWQDRAFTVALGVASGLLSGAFGVGGGIFMVPGMVLGGVGIHLAVGTSLVAVLGNAVSGTATHLALGYGPALAAVGIPLALGAVPGTRIGSKLAHRLHAERLKRAFGLFLVVVGVGMAAQALLA